MIRSLPESVLKYPRKYIFDYSDYNYYGGFVIVAYPHLEAFVSAILSNFWISVIPEIDLASGIIKLPEDDTDIKKHKQHRRIKHDFSPFFDSIPKRIVRLVEEYKDSHWEIIKAITLLGKDFEELIKLNPALAYLIIKLPEINPTFQLYDEVELMRKLILTKQKEILRYAFLPATERMRKIISKIKPEFLTKANFILFINLIVRAEKESKNLIKILSHTENINENLMSLFSVHHKLLFVLSGNIINELIQTPDFQKHIITLERILKRSNNINLPFPKIKSLAELNDVNKKNIIRVREKKKRMESFPEPPLAGTETIVPLLNVSQQISWSRKQNNCIRSFCGKVKNKKSFFYKIILEEEEATLEIKMQNGKFIFGDLLGKKNIKVSPRLRAHVKKWFQDSILNHK